MVQPTNNEIAAAYLQMWAKNLRTTPTEDEDAARHAATLADGIQQAADSLAAGNHERWWAHLGSAEVAIPRVRERPPSGPQQGASREPSLRLPLSSLDG